MSATSYMRPKNAFRRTARRLNVRVFVLIIPSLSLFFGSGPARPQSRDRFMKEGVITRNGNTATVKTNDARPLAQAIQAVSEEYGWVVDYEDPIYSDSETIDATNPEWRATHPNAPIVRGIAGSAFQCEFDERSALASTTGEEAALEKIIAEYNTSGNPGKFMVRDEGEETFNPEIPGFKKSVAHRYSIVGVSGILDTPVSIAVERRSAQATIDLIARELSTKTNMKVFNGGFANNLLIHSEVNVGGENLSARNLLIKTLNATQRPQIWRFLFDPGSNTYVFNIQTTARVERDAEGKKRLIWIDSPPVRRP